MTPHPPPTGLPPASIQADVVRPRVFLSYARSDTDFIRRLSIDLSAAGTACDFDLVGTDPENIETGIAVEDEWWKRLQDMILMAHVIVFVVSSASSKSRICDEEIAFALANSKRVIAVTYGSVNLAALPPRLSALNIAIHFGDGSEPGYTQAIDRLSRATKLDVHWHRVAADVAREASKWHAHGRGDEALARGAELQAINIWSARRPPTALPHSELVLAYLAASQQSEIDRLATFDSERARYLELMEVVRPMLEEEIRAREAQPPSTHPGVRNEQQVELERVKSLLGNRWHPMPAKHVHSTGATEGYAEIFVFSCCGKAVRDFLSTGEGDPPHQFRSDGCQEIPARLQHSQRSRSNRFMPLIRAPVLSSGSDDA